MCHHSRLNIVLMERSTFVVDKQLRTLKDFFSNMGIIVNTNKTKVMIIKSKNITHGKFIYDNNKLEEVSSYKYLEIDIHHKLKWNHNIEKMINAGWKSYFGIQNNYKFAHLVMWD